MSRFVRCVVLLSFVSGCASTTSKPNDAKNDSWLSQSYATALHPSKLFKPKQDKPEDFVLWQWTSALPQAVPRAESVASTVRRESAAPILAKNKDWPVQQASFTDDPGTLEVINIGGQKVANLSDLVRAEDLALERHGKTQVDISLPGNDPGHIVAVTLDRAELKSFCNSVSLEANKVRITQDGNPWIVVRSGDIRCKLTARVEKSRGLMQVVMSIDSSAASDLIQPRDVKAACDGQPLNCLDASETLACLYGKPGAKKEKDKKSATPKSGSFAVVSEREDYAIPTNYNSLAQKYEMQFGKSAIAAPEPALIVGAKERFPGSGILGDARALSGFLLQRQQLKQDAPTVTGWVIFSGEGLKKAENIEITVDLGSGPHKMQFSLPKS